MPSTRRTFLAATAGLATVGRARAEDTTRELDILAHRVHQLALTQGAAGDLTLPWQRANHATIAWTTADIGPLQDRLLREASLSRTDFGVGYLLNSRATPDVATLLEPIEPWMAKTPIADWDDIASGLRNAMRVGGKQIGVPVRHATNGLFYNAAMLAEHGIAAPPRTLEELVDQAKRVSGRPAAGGPPVSGLVMTAQLGAYPVMIARAFGGDFITADFKLLPNPAAMVAALATLRDLYEAGALPRSYAAITNEDQVTWLQQGRAAFAILPFSRYAQLNRPDQSRFPGQIKAIEIPLSAKAPAGTTMATAVEFWAMTIPANARDKALAWSFVSAMSSPEITLGEALNGNGPVRLSTYQDPRFTSVNPVATTEAQALATARVPFPAFSEASRAEAVLVEEVQAAVLGRKTPEQAVADTASRIKPMLPT